MKKGADLKKRLDTLRQEPEPPIAVTLHLDADLYRSLKSLAVRDNQPIETWIAQLLSQYTNSSEENTAE